MDGRQFLVSLPLGAETYTFYFTEVHLLKGRKVFLEAVATKGDPLSFEMKQGAGGRWTIIPPLPPRVKEVESVLAVQLKSKLS